MTQVSKHGLRPCDAEINRHQLGTQTCLSTFGDVLCNLELKEEEEEEENKIRKRKESDFAISEYNKQSRARLRLNSIIKGENQVVAGTNYRLVVAIKNGAATECYEAVVWEKPWQRFKSLTSFKLDLLQKLKGELGLDWGEFKGKD